MLRIITIPILLWLCIGCSVGAGYYDPFPSSSVARQIENTTGSNLSGGAGTELSFTLSIPLKFGSLEGLYWDKLYDDSGFLLVSELKNRYISNAVRLDGVTAGLTYYRVLKRINSQLRLYVTGGLGVGRQHLDIDGFPGDTAWGGHATASLIRGMLPYIGLFVEARHQILNFDTVFGELDASGFEVVVGIRGDAIGWAGLAALLY